MQTNNHGNTNGNGQRTPFVARCIRYVLGPATWKNILGWGGAIALLLVARWLLVDIFYIPATSMEPTLNGDPSYFRADRVAVNKFVYGPRYPFMFKRIFRLGTPQRWEIVAFNTVSDELDNKVLLKRIAGLPGERATEPEMNKGRGGGKRRPNGL